MTVQAAMTRAGRWFLVWAALALTAAAGRGQSGAPALPAVPWFDHVRQSAAISQEQLHELARRLHVLLKNGGDLEAFMRTVPADATSRVIFISLSDGLWPERTYFGCGPSFAEALRRAASILRQREIQYAEVFGRTVSKEIALAQAEKRPVSASLREKQKDPGRWDSLRLDVVQAVLPFDHFSIKRGKVMLTSVNGLAFRPGEGFAFTPEQLTGRAMVTAEHHLSEMQFGNIISESWNWGALKNWVSMASAEQTGRICLFEADSYYTDGQQVIRLFRGHPVQVDGRGRSPLVYAVPAAERLLGAWQGDGTYLTHIPEWVPGRSGGGEFLATLAETALSLSRLTQATGNRAYARGAHGVLQHLAKASKCYHGERGFFCVVEDEELEADEVGQQDPRQMASLRSNALTVLAMYACDEAAGTAEFQKTARDLAWHVARQQRPDGSFLPVVFFPEMLAPLDYVISETGRLEASALAVLALARYAAADAEMREASLKRVALGWQWLQAALARHDVASMPISGWLAECLTVAGGEAAPQLALATKMAAAAALGADTQPLLPDLFGSLRDQPNMTVAAENVRVVAVLAGWLQRQGKGAEGLELLTDAWPLWVFQQQAFMEVAAASALAQPHRYLGLFRDHLEGFGFDLDGQCNQLLGLLAVHAALVQLKLGDYPVSLPHRVAWTQAWNRLNQRPLCLDPALVVVDSGVQHASRSLTGGLIKGRQITQKVKGGTMRSGNNTITGRVLERRKRP